MKHNTTKWSLLTKECHPEEESDYLVAQNIDGVADMEKCTWYKKGTKISCLLMPDKRKPITKEMSTEERLLQQLFGDQESIVIPEDGFYRISYNPDYKEDEYEDFMEFPVLYGGYNNEIYWASLPVAPFGLMGQYEADREDKIEQSERKKEYEEKETKKLDDAIEHLTPEIYGTKDGWMDFARDLSGNYMAVRFKMNDMTRKRIVIAAAQAINFMNHFCEKYSDEEIVEAYSASRRGENEKLTEIYEYIIRYIVDNDASGYARHPKTRYVRWLIRSFINKPFPIGKHHGSREDWLRAYKSIFNVMKLQMWEKISIVEMSHCATSRMMRITKLLEIGAPEIIMRNEMRLLCEYLLHIIGEPIEPTEQFADVFGWTTDGEWVGKKYTYMNEEGEEEEEPPYPQDLPDYDENGFEIVYMFNTETGEWEADDAAEPNANELIERRNIFLKEMADLLEKNKGKSFSGLDGFTGQLDNSATEKLYFEVIKEDEKNLSLQINADMGVYDCAMRVLFTGKNTKQNFLYDKYDFSAEAQAKYGTLPECFIERNDLSKMNPMCIFVAN